MAEEEVRIESAAGELISGIPRSSAMMMEAAYLSSTSKRHVESGGVVPLKGQVDFSIHNSSS